MLSQILALPLLALVPSVQAAFGYSKSGNYYVIDAGSSNSLVFKVDSRSCDIDSIVYRGHELQQTSSLGTHIASGLGSASVSVDKITGSSGTNYIKVTCETDRLTHYNIVREGESIMYLATHTDAEPEVGELRWIARLDSSILPEEYPYGRVSTTAGGEIIEGSDVFLIDGETRSKFYSSTRFIDEETHCVYGNVVEEIHACIMTPHRETSSGGPFFRDIDSNNAGSSTNLYNYMNSNHVQTEKDYRMGLHGPYVMQFSRSGIPKLNEVDTSFFDEIPDIKGYVPESGRGYISGKASGVPSEFESVVHWFNDDAQYWTKASSGGSFKSPAMKPGSYSMRLYRGEYQVATGSASVSAGKTSKVNIESTFDDDHTTLFQIGEYDGQPFEFRNGDKFERMHPSDSRMESWGPLTYTVGSSSPSDFPMAIFKEVNSPVTISFHLDSDPGAATLRIATTLSFAGARPQATVNNWSGDIPPSPEKINSRGVTRGAYRGRGDQYDVDIPAGKLVAGDNTITISAVSGSGGSEFLSPNFVVDCVELFT